MNRRTMIQLSAWAASGALPMAAAGKPPTWDDYDGAIVIDGLGGPIQFNIPQQDLPLDEPALQAVRRSGVTAVNLTVNRFARDSEQARDQTQARIRAWLEQIETTPTELSLVRRVDDILKAKADGALGLILGFQDAFPLESDPSALAQFHADGLRILQLTYNLTNAFGSGCLALRDDGLTDRGTELIEELDALGILVDLSHCGSRTTDDGIAAASGPVAITHSGCRAVFNHPRNKSDATLRDLAERGGVVGIYLMPYLNAAGEPDGTDVIRHIEHALHVCGEDHVGIGTDQGLVPLNTSGNFPKLFAAAVARREAAGISAPREDTIPYVPELNGPRRMETLASLLANRGHGDRVIEKVLGQNFLRLFSEVWA